MDPRRTLKESPIRLGSGVNFENESEKCRLVQMMEFPLLLRFQWF